MAQTSKASANNQDTANWLCIHLVLLLLITTLQSQVYINGTVDECIATGINQHCSAEAAMVVSPPCIFKSIGQVVPLAKDYLIWNMLVYLQLLIYSRKLRKLISRSCNVQCVCGLAQAPMK